MRTIPTLFAALAFAASVPASAATAVPAQSEPAKLTAEQWREDLRFMASEMKARHANLYHQVSQQQFDVAVADLDRRIPTLQRNQIIVGMMRIAAMVGDGHTRIEPRKDKAFGFRSLPLKLYWFDDGIYVWAAKPDQRDLIGARVDTIGGVPIGEAIRRTSELVSQETVSGPRLFVPLYLAMPDILQALGMSDTRKAATLTLVRGGRRWTARVPVGEVAPPWPGDTDVSLMAADGWLDARSGAQPLWLQAPLDKHRMVELPDRHALYVQLNMVADTDDESLKAFGERILTAVQRTNPKTVVLDLRLDQGGNGDLVHRFVASLIRAEDADTRLFVLVGRGTFSASQFILDDVGRHTDAIFIGEPASSRPTGYGDAYKSIMPNSGIAVRSSIKYWQFWQDMRPFTPIDLAAPLTFADYVAGRDPALEAALSYDKGPDLTDQLETAAKSGGADVAAKAAQSYVDDPAHRYRDVESELIDSEQALLDRNQGGAALAVSRWSAGRFPRSSNLALVHAYVAFKQGEKEEAVKAINMALSFDPNNRSAQSVKETIEAK